MNNRMIKRADWNSAINMRNDEIVKQRNNSLDPRYYSVDDISIVSMMTQRINAAIDGSRDAKRHSIY